MTERLRIVGPAAIVAAAVAVPLFYVPRADSPFADPKLALLSFAGALGLAAWLLAWARGARQPGAPLLRAGLAAVVATTLLAAAVAALRPSTGAPYALGEIARLAAIIGVAAAAAQAARDATWRQRLFEAIAIAAGLVSLIGVLQHLRLLPFALPVISVPGSTFGNRNMGGEAVAMSLPFLLAVVGSRSGRGPRPWFAVGLLLAALVYLAATRARGAWIGGAAGLGAYLAVRRPAVSRRIALLGLPIGAAVLLAVLLPGRWQARDAHDTKRYEPGARVVLDAVDPTSSVARTRLGLWRRTLSVYREHPLTGVGPGNFSVLFPRHAEPGAAADGVMSATMVPRRPHNELLERLTETGPLGLVAFVGLCAAAFASAGAVGRAARARPAGPATAVGDLDAAAAGAGGIAACLGCGLTAFPLAMPATALLFGVALGLLDALSPGARGAVGADPTPPVPPTPRAQPGRAAAVAAAGVAAAIVVGAGWLSSGVLASSYWRGQARDAVGLGTARQPDLPGALAALARAARAPRLDYARFDVALRTAQLDLQVDRALPAREAADRALALEPYSPHAWAARAAAELALRDEAQAGRDATRALTLFSDLPMARATLDEVRRLAPRGP